MQRPAQALDNSDDDELDLEMDLRIDDESGLAGDHQFYDHGAGMHYVLVSRELLTNPNYEPAEDRLPMQTIIALHAKSANLESLKELYRDGHRKFDGADDEGNTPLMIAIMERKRNWRRDTYQEIIKWLLETCAPNLALTNKQGLTAYNLAKQTEDNEVMAMLDDYRQKNVKLSAAGAMTTFGVAVNPAEPSPLADPEPSLSSTKSGP
jgi:ankyrin repeat protein